MVPIDRRTALAVGAGVIVAAKLSAADTVEPAKAEGYTDKTSYRPGDELRLHVSCAAPTYDIEIARLGEKRDVGWQCRLDGSP